MKATTTSGGTPARQKMIATMDMKGLSFRTQDNYLRSVSALAGFYDRPPQTLSAEEVGAWVLGRIAAGRCPRTTMPRCRPCVCSMWTPWISRRRSRDFIADGFLTGCRDPLRKPTSVF